MAEFKIRLKKDMTNNGGKCIKKGAIVKVTNISCDEPHFKQTCQIEKNGVVIYTKLENLFK